MASILLYADADDYAAWPGPTPTVSTVAALLRSASLAVRRNTMTAVYAVDDDGLPTDTDDIDAMRDATCAQASALAANSIDPAAGPGGDLGMVQATSIGSASISFVTDSATAGLRRSLLTDLCPEAFEILSNAGLTGQPAYVGRTTP